jgi:hypothetical protein
MKPIILALPTYRNTLGNATVTSDLSRRITHFTGATGQTLTLPSATGKRKEFIIVNTSVNVVTIAGPTGKLNGINATSTAVVAGNSITLAAASVGHFQAVDGKWFRV